MKIIVKRLIREGKLDEVIKAYEELVELTRKEEGCIAYELCQDEKDVRRLAVIEEWENQEVLDKHKNSQHYTRLLPIINELTEMKSNVERYNKLI